MILLNPYSITWAGEEHVVELPIVFSKEGSEVKTSVCLRVRQKVYDAPLAPWTSFKRQAQTGPEKFLIETISAMVNKDGMRLRELSHPQLGRDTQKFQTQASAYFRHFGALKLREVWGYIRFGDFLAFFLQLNFQGTSGFVAFPFARQEAGNFGFLPYKTDNLTLRLVNGWFNSDWGPGTSQRPTYCIPSLLEGMTHKVTLNNAIRPSDFSPELLFSGKDITGNEKNGQPHAVLRDKMSALKNALNAGRMGEYFDGFTERGRQRIEPWFFAAKEKDRRKYVESFVSQEPFYVINAEPLWVVYTRTGSSGVQALYFIQDKKGKFRWTNAVYGSTIDRIFKSDRFIAAASSEKPFDNWRIGKAAQAD